MKEGHRTSRIVESGSGLGELPSGKHAALQKREAGSKDRAKAGGPETSRARMGPEGGVLPQRITLWLGNLIKFPLLDLVLAWVP